jgi:hypothetical protein
MNMRGLKDKMAIGMRMLGIIAVTLLTCAVVTYAADDLASKIKSFAPGTTIKSSEINSNFQAIVNGMPAIKVDMTPNDPLFTLSGTVQNLTSVTVNPPMDGVLLLIVGAQAGLDSGEYSGLASAAIIRMCITETSGACGSSGESFMISLNAPTYPIKTSLSLPITYIAAKPCYANTPVTYYLTALRVDPSGGLCQINGAKLWAIFLPGWLQ